MQEYFLKLFGSYRSFIHVSTPTTIARLSAPSAASLQSATGGGSKPGSQNSLARASVRDSMSAPQPAGSGGGAAKQGGQDKGGDETLKGYGHLFDQNGFVASQR